MGESGLEGTFATEHTRRIERRWQRAGVGALAGIVLLAMVGQMGRPMDVIRAAGVYAVLLAMFRIAGRRTLAQVTTFDLILLLIIGDASQQALVTQDGTFADAIAVIATLVLMDIGLARLKHTWPTLDAVLDGLPLPLMVKGRLRQGTMDAEAVSHQDLLTAARQAHGLGGLEQVEHAVLEQDGGISIVPGRRGASNQ